MTKTTTVMSALVIGLMMSSAAFAQSTVKSSNVNVNSENKKTTTVAVGKNSIANTGGVTLKKAKVIGSRVNVNSKNKKTTTVAVGRGATANTGGIVMK